MSAKSPCVTVVFGILFRAGHARIANIPVLIPVSREVSASDKVLSRAVMCRQGVDAEAELGSLVRDHLAVVGSEPPATSSSLPRSLVTVRSVAPTASAWAGEAASAPSLKIIKPVRRPSRPSFARLRDLLVIRPMTGVANDALRVGKAACKRQTKKSGRPSGLPICRSSPWLAPDSGASAKFPILRICVESRSHSIDIQTTAAFKLMDRRESFVERRIFTQGPDLE